MATDVLCPGCARMFRPALEFEGALCRTCAARFHPGAPRSRLQLLHQPGQLRVRWAGSPTWTRELEAVPGWLRLPAMAPDGPRRVVPAAEVKRLLGSTEDMGQALPPGPGFLRQVLRLAWHLVVNSGYPDNRLPLPEPPAEPPLLPVRRAPSFRLDAELLSGERKLLVDAVADARELNELAFRILDLRRGEGPAPSAWAEPVRFVGVRPIQVRPTRASPPEEGRFSVEPERLEAHAHDLELRADLDGVAWRLRKSPEQRAALDDVQEVVAQEVLERAGAPRSFQLTLVLRKGRVVVVDRVPGPALPLFLEQELRRLWRLEVHPAAARSR